MLIALDFETEAIANRPEYPPKPVGLAMKMGNKPGSYYSWGHPTNNNSTLEAVRGIAKMLVSSVFEEDEFAFHNAPFDVSVFEERLDVKWPWDRTHDTMLMAFLDNPHGELSLKPLAEQHLGEPPTERDAVRDWLAARGHGGKNWGAFISKAPGSLVAPYAIGDVERTAKLYEFYKSKLNKRGMM